MSPRVDYLHRHFSNLYKGPGTFMVLTVSYVYGTGMLWISKDEWNKRESIPEQKALIKSRLEHLYRQLKQEHENAPE